MPKEPEAAGRLWERRCHLNGEPGLVRQQGLRGTGDSKHLRWSGGLMSRHRGGLSKVTAGSGVEGQEAMW